MRNRSLATRHVNCACPIRSTSATTALPFDREQLHAIFTVPLYRGCVDGERGYDKVGCQRPRYGGFSVPLIAQVTGARADEICQPRRNLLLG